MQIEYEATFPNINKEEMRNRLRQVGATMVREEFLQKRVVFNLPKGHEVFGAWVRVRDEGERVTMSYKVVDNRMNRKIEYQKEICLTVSSFSDAENFLANIGCQKKAYQESLREIWKLDEVEVCLDEWPHLEPFLEIEGQSEEAVRWACEELGYDYGEAMFCSVDTLYNLKYGVAEEVINNQTSEITFAGKNPFGE